MIVIRIDKSIFSDGLMYLQKQKKYIIGIYYWTIIINLLKKLPLMRMV